VSALKKYLALLFCCSPLVAFAQDLTTYTYTPNTLNGTYHTQFLTAAQLASAQAIPNIPPNTTMINICVQGTGTVLYRDDGVAPTSSVGQGPITAPICYPSAVKPQALKFIISTGSPTMSFGFYVQR
jgi:hypothetical protein